MTTRILVTDDAEAGRYFKVRILRQAGYSVLEAGRGDETLKLVEAEDPALVVLDIKLPDIDGAEVCRRIKHRNPRVMVLQTSAAIAERAAGFHGGADSYLAEPFEPDELVAPPCCDCTAPKRSCGKPMRRSKRASSNGPVSWRRSTIGCVPR
jgi:DNA-binding response OmpR family regulator